MADPKDDKSAKIQAAQAKADNAWIERCGEKYDPEANGMTVGQIDMMDNGEIPFPPNITEAHRKEMKEWKEQKLKWRKEAEEEEKAKAEAFYWVFLGLGMILIYVPLSGLMAWGAFESGKIWWGGWFFSGCVAVGLWYGMKWIIIPITAVGERGNANRSALMLIGFFLLILVVIVFGTILVMKK